MSGEPTLRAGRREVDGVRKVDGGKPQRCRGKEKSKRRGHRAGGRGE